MLESGNFHGKGTFEPMLQVDDISPEQLTEGAPSMHKGRALYKCKGPEVAVGRCLRNVQLSPEPSSQPLQEIGAHLWPSDHRAAKFKSLVGIPRQTPHDALRLDSASTRERPPRVWERLSGAGEVEKP